MCGCGQGGGSGVRLMGTDMLPIFYPYITIWRMGTSQVFNIFVLVEVPVEIQLDLHVKSTNMQTHVQYLFLNCSAATSPPSCMLTAQMEHPSRTIVVVMLITQERIRLKYGFN